MSCTTPLLLIKKHEVPREVLPVFWKQLLWKAKEKNVRIHEKCFPVEDTRLSAKIGLYGICFDYVISPDRIAVELWIDTGDQQINKRVFDRLYKKHKAIEQDFQGNLLWERRGNQRSSRIRTFVGQGGLNHGEVQWSLLQDEMVGVMERFFKAIRPTLPK